ncbi:MAG: FkbM family methyltransferase [Hyphomicrobiaceae bacterium]|nr:FkbM family methyltransferase [Hyphomicrobiaceae bacterium]
MTLSPTDFMHAMIAFTGAYERDLSARMVGIAKKGGVLVDVGANWGYFTLLWGSANPANRVIAVEASPRNFQPLKHNIDLNKLSQQVTTYNVAAGKDRGAMPFDLGPEGIYGWGGLAVETSASKIDVPVQRLDDLCSAVPSIDVLKIDVEGAEAIVLAGATNLLRQKRIKRIFLELNEIRMKALGISPDEPRDILERNGYKCWSRGDDLEAVVA